MLRRAAVLALTLVVAAGTGGCQPGQASTAPSQSALAPGCTGLRAGSRDAGGLKVVELASLPKQAATTYDLVVAGGPFPYEQDGSTYNNFNRVLPKQARGYYSEYTVTTPGRKSRGARRIVHGSGCEFFYTSDHYDSFVRIA